MKSPSFPERTFVWYFTFKIKIKYLKMIYSNGFCSFTKDFKSKREFLETLLLSRIVQLDKRKKVVDFQTDRLV